MNIIKKITIVSIGLIAVIIGYFILIFNPIFIGDSKTYLFNYSHWSENLYNPVESIDFTSGDNKIIIYFDKDDVMCLPSEVKQWSLLYCTDNSTIQQIKEYFEFEWNGKDYAETTDGYSKIYFFKDNKVVFQSPFHFAGNISIKFPETGWIFTTKYDRLKDNFAKFKPLYNPVILY